jgi:hypothetical protein
MRQRPDDCFVLFDVKEEEDEEDRNILELVTEQAINRVQEPPPTGASTFCQNFWQKVEAPCTYE